MSKGTKDGRSRTGGKFVQLHAWVMQTAAWRHSSPADRAVLIEVMRRYDGKNNGYIALGVRDAAEGANVNKDTASKCLARLQERGFLECAQPGGFSTNNRQATEWRLTMHRCDRTRHPPSKAFVRWKPEEQFPCPKTGTPLSETKGQGTPISAVSVPPFRTVA